MINLVLLTRWFRIGLLGLAFVTAGMASAMAEPRIALIIGNSNYTQPMGALKNPASDAKLISKALKSVGFQVTTLLDADQRAMKRAISDFGAAVSDAGPSAVALFFYAGHGIQVDGTNYLVPVGARIERKGDVDLEAIEAEALLKQLEYAGAGVSIVVLDACRNNPLPRSFRGGDRGLARMDAPTGSFVAYSTAPGDVAVDGDGANSPFAAALAEEVGRPGSSVEEVFRSVRRKVMAATGEQQVPWDSSSLTAPFYFLPASQQVASAEAEPAAAPAPTAGTDQMLSAEVLMWETIKDSNRAGDFQAYLKRFPDGVYSDLARIRLGELGATAPTKAEVAAPETEVKVAAPEPEVEIAAVATQETTSASTSSDRSMVVSASLRGEIEKYLGAAAKSGRQQYVLAIAKDGSRIGIGKFTPKVASGWAGSGDSQDAVKIATEFALKKCGGKDACRIAYVGDKKQGGFTLAFADSGTIAEPAPAPAGDPLPEPKTELAAMAPVESTGGFAPGATWAISASLQADVEKFLKLAATGGRQIRVLAIAEDGSRIGIGKFTPKVESGWAGGGDTHDPVKIVTKMALEDCGEGCRVAYVGDKKQGDFDLAFE